MKNIDLKEVGKKVGDIALVALEFAFVGAFLRPSRKSTVHVIKNYGNVTATYSGAAKAIVKSNMLDSYKRDVMGVLSTEGDADYYETVINIVNSDMLDSYKRDMIEKMSEEF